MQLVVLAHETELSTDWFLIGFGLAVTVHEVPSHVSTSVCGTKPSSRAPTATQLVAFVQETPKSWPAPVVSGLDATVQVVPSHLSMRVWNGPAPRPEVPTATHADALVHD